MQVSECAVRVSPVKQRPARLEQEEKLQKTLGPRPIAEFGVPNTRFMHDAWSLQASQPEIRSRRQEPDTCLSLGVRAKDPTPDHFRHR